MSSDRVPHAPRAQWVVEIWEGECLYALVGPWLDRNEAKGWTRYAADTLELSGMAAKILPLWDAGDTLAELRADLERARG